MCFRLVVAGSSTAAPSERVCGFRLAPSTELCQTFGCTLGDDGWLTAETAVDETVFWMLKAILETRVKVRLYLRPEGRPFLRLR